MKNKVFVSGKSKTIIMNAKLVPWSQVLYFKNTKDTMITRLHSTQWFSLGMNA